MATEATHAGGDILQRTERRGPRTLAQLYDRYGRPVYATVLRIVRNQAVTEGLVLETFLRLWNRAQSFDEHKVAVGPWLLAGARQRAIDYVRSQKGRSGKLAASEENEDLRQCAGLETGVSFSEQVRRAKQTLAQLPENQRQVIELACFDGLSQDEMAAKLGQQPATVKIWVRSALAGLRKAMEVGVAQ